MSLDQKDLEQIENVIRKYTDDQAVSISRSFERIEEKIEAIESRMYARISEVEDRIESTRQDVSDSIADLREEFRKVEEIIKAEV